MKSIVYIGALLLLLCLTHQKITIEQLAELDSGELSDGDLVEVV
jgi:hypothetical protein